MKNLITHKRGDTFERTATLYSQDENGARTPIILTGCTIRAQMRYGDTLVQNFTTSILNDLAGRYKIFASDTDAKTWGCTLNTMDIEFTFPGNRVMSTETIHVQIEKDETHD